MREALRMLTKKEAEKPKRWCQKEKALWLRLLGGCWSLERQDLSNDHESEWLRLGQGQDERRRGVPGVKKQSAEKDHLRQY